LLRIFRIGRAFKLIRKYKSLKIIFNTFFMSLRAMINLGSLLMLFLLIFALLGVQLFGNVKMSDPLDDNLNFKNVGSAILLLLKVITGDAWHDVQYAVSRPYSIRFQCIQEPTYDDYLRAGGHTVGCGDRISSTFYFFFFIIMLMMILLNIFIAIILMGYEQTRQMDSNEYTLEVQEDFINKWSLYDPDACGFIPVAKLDSLLLALDAPLGWEVRYKRNPKLKDHFYSDLKFNPHGHGLYTEYYDVLEKLALHLTGKQMVKAMNKDCEVPINHFDSIKA
jgi:hypothetical protein